MAITVAALSLWDKGAIIVCRLQRYESDVIPFEVFSELFWRAKEQSEHQVHLVRLKLRI